MDQMMMLMAFSHIRTGWSSFFDPYSLVNIKAGPCLCLTLLSYLEQAFQRFCITRKSKRLEAKKGSV